jgi:hypothetical protein
MCMVGLHGMCGMLTALLWCSTVGEMVVVETVAMAIAAWLPWTGLVRCMPQLDERATSLLLARRAFIACQQNETMYYGYTHCNIHR